MQDEIPDITVFFESTSRPHPLDALGTIVEGAPSASDAKALGLATLAPGGSPRDADEAGLARNSCAPPRALRRW